MNGEIARLAEQAAQESFDTEHDSALEVSNDDVSYQIPGGFIQCFAESIVRECMRMCEVAEVGYDTHGHTKEANGCVSAKEYIAEHFGVEA